MKRAIFQASIAVSFFSWVIAFSLFAKVNGWSWRQEWWAVLIPAGVYFVGLLALWGYMRWRDKS